MDIDSLFSNDKFCKQTAKHKLNSKKKKKKKRKGEYQYYNNDYFSLSMVENIQLKQHKIEILLR